MPVRGDGSRRRRDSSVQQRGVGRWGTETAKRAAQLSRYMCVFVRTTRRTVKFRFVSSSARSSHQQTCRTPQFDACLVKSSRKKWLRRESLEDWQRRNRMKCAQFKRITLKLAVAVATEILWFSSHNRIKKLTFSEIIFDFCGVNNDTVFTLYFFEIRVPGINFELIF